MKTVSKKKESAPVIITELVRTELLKQVEQIRNVQTIRLAIAFNLVIFVHARGEYPLKSRVVNTK